MFPQLLIIFLHQLAFPKVKLQQLVFVILRPGGSWLFAHFQKQSLNVHWEETCSKGAEKRFSSLTFSFGAKILIPSLNESLGCIVPEMACNRYSCDKPCISMELRTPSIGRKWPADLETERHTKELLPSTEGSADAAQRNLWASICKMTRLDPGARCRSCIITLQGQME